MSIQDKSALVLSPANWTTLKNRLERTPTGLLNMVGWYGSTHAAANWRKHEAFLAGFEREQVPGFDPQLDEWDPSFAAIEAEVMAQAAVIIIRLENKELLDGSLGSIAEIGLALTSAALRGQVVIVSIEEGLLKTLNEPGAIAQYMTLELFLEQWETSPELANLLHLHRGDDLAGLAGLASRLAGQQMEEAQPGVDFAAFLKKRNKRRQNYPLRVLLGGSGGPYHAAYRDTFQRKKAVMMAGYRARGHSVKILSEGAIAAAWKIPYGSLDPISVALTTRTLLTIENEFKREADVLLLPIMRESASKAAATEIGLLLLSALTTGQEINIVMEPFDPVDYLRYQLVNGSSVPVARDEREIRQFLSKTGVEDALLVTAVQREVLDAYRIIRAMARNGRPAFNQVKQSLLGQTQIFKNADNIRRVRTLTQAHLETLHADPNFPDFFSYSTRLITASTPDGEAGA